MRVENQPYGRLNEIIYDQAFTVHPYKHPTIGSMKDLEAASIDDVRDFFQTYYVPNNATLVLVGDFDTKQALAAGHAVPRARAEVRARRCRATSRRSRRRRRSGASRSRSPGRCRRSSSRTTSPTTAIPTRIRCTSRRRCCPTARARASTASWSTRSSIALAAFGGGNIIEDPNLFYAVAIVQPGHTPAGGDRRADRRARSAAERADHARTSCSRRRTSSRATTSSAASRTRTRRRQLGARGRDPQRHQDRRRRVRHLQEHHAGRRPARARKTYFTPENRLVMTIMPKGDAVRGRSRADAARSGCWLAVASLALALPVARPRRSQNWPSERPPRPLPARDVKFPPYADPDAAERPAGDRGVASRAAGGQPAAARPRRRRAGSRRTSRASRTLAASLLDQGTTTKSAEQIADAIDSIGGALGTGAGTDLTLRQRGRDEGQLGRRARPGVRPGAAPGVRARGDRAAAAADRCRG